MTTDELSKLIPDEVVEAATLAIGEAISLWLHEHPGCVLEDVETHKLARAAIAAALAAWPGMDTIMLPRMMQPGHFVPQDYIRLPLTEKQDDKA